MTGSRTDSTLGPQAEQWLAAGRFDTVCIGAGNPRLKSYDLFSRYGKSKEITANGFKGYLLWDKK